MQLCNQEDLDGGEEVVLSSPSVRWLSWTQLASDSLSDPSSVLTQLIKMKQYELARQWSIIHKIPHQLREVGNLLHTYKEYLEVKLTLMFTIGN